MQFAIFNNISLIQNRYEWLSPYHIFTNTWVSQKVFGNKFSILNFFCVVYPARFANRNLWVGGISAFKIRVIVWESDAAVQTQIIVCFFL
jgi:hypothetical protein